MAADDGRHPGRRPTPATTRNWPHAILRLESSGHIRRLAAAIRPRAAACMALILARSSPPHGRQSQSRTGWHCAYMLDTSRCIAQQVHPLGTRRSTRSNYHAPPVVHSSLHRCPPGIHPSPLDRPSLAPGSSLACPRVGRQLPSLPAARSSDMARKAAPSCYRALLPIECCRRVDEWSTPSASS